MSREIPIVVDPGYEANFRNRRRGSEPQTSTPRLNAEPNTNYCDDASNSFHNRKFQRRHSEDPNTTNSWETTYYGTPPRYNEHQRLLRRGSVPASWDRPHDTRPDRFEQIVESLMNADDSDLLSGIVKNDFDPFHRRGTHEQHPDGIWHGRGRTSSPIPHERIVHTHRPASPSSRPFGMSVKDKNGYIEIPIQICESDEDKINAVHEEKQEENTENATAKQEENSKAGNTIQDEKTAAGPKMVEEAVQTDGEVIIEITAETNTEPEEKEEEKDATTKTVESEVEFAKSSEKEDDAKPGNGDEAKLSYIHDIEKDLKQTHEQVSDFKATDSKDSNREYLKLEELLMKALMSLDAVEANGNTIVREARRSVVMQVQQGIKELENKKLLLPKK